MKLTHLKSPKTNLIYALHLGISNPHINELIANTRNEPDLLVHSTTADWQNGKGRFATRPNFDHWFAQGRSIYTLISQDDHLSGIAWFAKRQIPLDRFPAPLNFNSADYSLTFAIRLYGEARGSGLAVPFTKAIFDNFKTGKEYLTLKHKGIWLETSASNLPAISTYQKLGFTKVSATSDNTRILLISPL